MAQSSDPALPGALSSWPQTLEDASKIHLTTGDIVNTLRNIRGSEEGLRLKVDSFAFAQLEPNRICLLAGTDSTGRGLFSTVELIYCEAPDSCTDYPVYDAPPHLFHDQLVDLDHNGLQELIVKEWAGGYEGAISLPVFKYRIYKMSNGTPADVSDQYKAFYESTLIPRMKSNAERLRARYKAQTDLTVINALEALSEDDYERRILKDPKAGLEHAKLWSHSSDSRLKRFAIDALSGINDPEADQILADMANDDNTETAKRAALEIEDRAQKKMDSSTFH